MITSTIQLISIIVFKTKDKIRSKYKMIKAAVSIEPLNKNCMQTKLILHQLLIFYYNEWFTNYCTVQYGP